jgi:RNA polymerase sigma factor (sigma-70 family)
MKIANPPPEWLAAATGGDLGALDRVLAAVQPGVFNLALRLLGHREDAQDATQEILLRVTTHLSSFRGESAFSTWVFQVAKRHLLQARTRAAESPTVSFEALDEKLAGGLQLAASLSAAPALTPEDKLAARQVALGCTQGMLMALDREARFVYLLDLLFALSGEEGAAVCEISPAAYRQRLSRAKRAVEGFAQRTCGRVNAQADCRCERQLPALRWLDARGQRPAPQVVALHPAEHAEAEALLDALQHGSAAVALMRAHPDYQAPEALRGGIRAVLRAAVQGGGQPTGSSSLM